MEEIWTKARALRNGATDAEQVLWRHLRGRQLQGLNFRRQYPIAGYIADFACVEAKLVIELDGGSTRGSGIVRRRTHTQDRMQRLSSTEILE